MAQGRSRRSTPREKSYRWTVVTLVTAVVSSLIGFWLLDGVAWIASFFGISLIIEPPARIASTIVCVSFALIVEQATMVNQLLTDQRQELVSLVRADVQEHLAAGVKDLLAMADVLALSRDLQNRHVRTILSELGSLLEPIATYREPLRSGVVAWMQGNPLDQYRKASSDLTGEGVAASLSQHVAVTRAMFGASKRSYVQINQSAYSPETEWSREWKDFVRNSKSGDRTFEYVVLNSREYFNDAKTKTKLREMQVELRACGGRLLVCDRQLVNDSIGDFELNTNLELFDDEVLKTQGLNRNGYRGGITLQMGLGLADQSPGLMKVVRAVQGAAVPFKLGA